MAVRRYLLVPHGRRRSPFAAAAAALFDDGNHLVAARPWKWGAPATWAPHIVGGVAVA